MNIREAILRLLEVKGDNTPIAPDLDVGETEEEKALSIPKCTFEKDQGPLTDFSLESPENLAAVLIFVVATQEKVWPAVVTKFPELMVYLDTYGGLFPSGEKRLEAGFPKEFTELVLGNRATSIDEIWKNRDMFYQEMAPAIRKFKNAGESKKDEAAFEVYLTALGVPSHAFPKGGFATQLLVGRLGCIDSINAQLLDVPDSLLKLVDPNKPELGKTFKSATKTKIQGKALSAISKSTVDLAAKYAEWLNNLKKTSSNEISKDLWVKWCKIVAHKINFPTSKFTVQDTGGFLKTGQIKSKYPLRFSSDNIAINYPRGPIKGNKAHWTDVSAEHPFTISRGRIKENKMTERLRQIIMEELQKVLQEEKELTAKQKELAAKYPPKDKITRGDIIKAATEKKSDKKKEEELEEMSSMSAGHVEGGFGNKINLEEEEEEDSIVEYLTEEEAKKQPKLGKVTRNPAGSNKKFHVYVKCNGKVKKISFGDPGLSIKRDSPERRKSFRARHKCDKAEGKNRCTARYWACMTWRRGTSVSDMTKEEE